MTVESIEPTEVWSIFEELTAIPRPSKHEEKVREWLIRKAKSHKEIIVTVDKTGNIILKKPASAGKENIPTLILQAHMDMVCEKVKGSTFDFMKDKIEAIEKDGWVVTTTSTTLGADNGIGVAMILALFFDKELTHGPLEALITYDEETGLTGAAKLDPSTLNGRYLINIDSEDFGVITISSAGGGDSILTKSYVFEPLPSNWKIFRITVDGLSGGHSGVDIHLPKGNSIKFLSRIIFKGLHDLRIIKIFAGSKRNAIPRYAECLVACAPEREKNLLYSFQEMFTVLKNEYLSYEPNLKLTINEEGSEGFALTINDSKEVIHLLMSLPHGPYRYSPEIKELVETSTNLAIINLSAEGSEIVLSTRSSIESQLEYQRHRIESIAKLAGNWNIKQDSSYPGWPADPNSPLLKYIIKKYQIMLNGKEPVVEAIHAGLECGIIGKHFNGKMQMVSIGPDIHHPHSPDEKIKVDSVANVYSLLKEIIKDFPLSL